MKATLLLSCVSVLIISSHSQLFLPHIQAGFNTGVKKVEKVFSDIGLVPTTAHPPAQNPIENHHHHPSANTLTPAQPTNVKAPITAPAQPTNVKAPITAPAQPTNVKAPITAPAQPTNNKAPITAPAQSSNVKVDKKPAVNTPNVVNSNNKLAGGKPDQESGSKAGFIQGPGSLSDPELPAPVKNNATSLDQDGTVVFPEDTHNPDAAVVNNSRACVAGQTYPANHPCGKGYDAKKNCVDGTSLDENNECRPDV